MLSHSLFCTGIDEYSGGLKLQKGREKTDKEKRKEKKRERKEKKRERSKVEHGNSEQKEHKHKKMKHDGRSELHGKDSYLKETRNDVIEQLEKSGLTEEHELPSSFQMPCESSESTQNSGKSMKPAASNVSHKGTGTIVRIRFSLQKHKAPEQTATNEEPCFSGRSTEAPIEQEPAAEIARSQLSSERRSSSSSSQAQEEERQFRDLILNWKHPPLNLHLEDSAISDDLGWLSTTTQQLQRGNPIAKSCGVDSICSEDMSHGSAAISFQPRAHYLPEFNMYQLPYTIPY